MFGRVILSEGADRQRERGGGGYDGCSSTSTHLGADGEARKLARRK